MSTSDKVRARLQLLDERLARLRADRDRLAARVSRTERKRETRRKIVLGGTILAAIDHEGVPAIRTRADLERWLDTELSRPPDRRVFGLPTHATA
jgi:acyl-coenzyme A thioesterase PaaI-like protein